jgi:hypothetical protein
MNKGLNRTPFLIQVICIPISWIIAMLKILVAIPAWIIAKCNDIMENID